jgi:V8-like Glu-specific endopeptidase
MLVTACGMLAAPAEAVVGGTPVDEANVPWFASLNGCGGILVAPDRVLTAGHCVHGRTPDAIAQIRVAGTWRRGVRFAMHPDWRRANGANRLEDVAVIQLDAAVAGVPPVALGGPVPPRVTVIGRGLILGIAAPAGQQLDELRAAQLRPVSDRQCARAYRRERGEWGERFHASQMLCATDVDGLAPLSSPCHGDSGGPLYSGPDSAPVVHGVVSWGGDGCGLDRDPSVYAGVSRARAFIVARRPAWAPMPDGPSTVSGVARPGRTLSCGVSSWSAAPTRIRYRWEKWRGGAPVDTVGRGRRYTVKRRDVSSDLMCTVTATNAGGLVAAPTASESWAGVRPRD